jgi:transcriptional regulator with XRE-family HTH domain
MQRLGPNQRLGRLIKQARQRKGWGLHTLSVEVGYFRPRKIANTTQLTRLEQGRWQDPPRELVAKLVEVLRTTPEQPGLSPQEEAEVWDIMLELAGLSRDDLTDEGFRRFRTEAVRIMHEAIKGTWTLFPPSWRWALGMGRTGLGAAA